MIDQEKKSILANIYNLKCNLLKLKIKKSSGDQVGRNEIKNSKKEIARLFTKINNKK
jgi:ribosomal protein L29